MSNLIVVSRKLDDSAIPAIWLGLGLLLVFLLLSFIFLFVKIHIKRIRLKDQEKHNIILNNQKELLKVSLETEERERKRIAHYLHDDLISQLYRIKLMNKDTSISNLIKSGIKTARLVSHELTPPMLNELSIENLMVDFLFPYNEKYSIHFRYNPKRESSLNNTFKLHVFRIFQQLIINIDKHAKASKILVTLRFTRNYFCLTVLDNGIGYNPKGKLGLGLRGIESRVQILKGSHRIKKVIEGTLFIFITKRHAIKELELLANTKTSTT